MAEDRAGVCQSLPVQAFGSPVPLPAPPAARLPATVSPGQVLVTCEREAPAESPLAAGLLVVISPGQLGTHMEMLLPGNAATSCPEVPSPGRFLVPLPTSSCCCSEPLQRSRFTSHKSVWRGNGIGSSVCLVKGGSRDCPCPTASGVPAVTRTWPPPPAWLARCPKWIREPWKQAGSKRAVGCHSWGQADGAQGP